MSGNSKPGKKTTVTIEEKSSEKENNSQQQKGGQKGGNRKAGKKPRTVSAPSQRRKEKRISKAISRNPAAYESMSMYANTFEQARSACQRCIEGFLLGKCTYAKGFLYPRHDAKPTFQRLFPFTKVLGNNIFDSNLGSSFNLRPNPYRTLDLTLPPTGGNRGKDKWENISIETHYENNVKYCFDHDITCTTGSLTAATRVVEGFPQSKHYATSTKEFKDGNKIYASGPSTFIVAPSFSTHNIANYDVNFIVQFFQVITGGSGALSIGQVCHGERTLTPGEQAAFVIDNDYEAWANAMQDDNTFGFAIVITVSANGDRETITANGSTVSISLSQGEDDPDRQPVFGAAYTYQAHSIFDLIGAPSRGLQAELGLSDQMAVTGFSLLLSNYTAPLNKAGRVMGALVPVSHSQGLPLESSSRISTLVDFPVSVYRMVQPMLLSNGCHFSYMASPEEATFVSKSFYENANPNGHNRSYAAVAIDAKGAFAAGAVPNLQLHGQINVEWRSTSMTFTPRIPANNVGLFADVLAQCIAQMDAGALWGENPAHFKKIRDFASKIVHSKTFKTVVRDVALVGVESLAAVFLM